MGTNIFLVGNGFDLHHKFPTRYIDFLNVVEFLIQNQGTECNTIGKILGNKELMKKNTFIQECYQYHRKVCDSLELDKNSLHKLVSAAKENMWFKYLSNCVSKNIGWIDFEKEVLRVLRAFKVFFEGDDKKFGVSDRKIFFDGNAFPDNAEDRYILSQFGLFFDETVDSCLGYSKIIYVKEKYCVEEIVGSEEYYLKTEEIVGELYNSLRTLADILRDYLLLFVDTLSKKYESLSIYPRSAFLPVPSRVFSFNYTNTFEILYGGSSVEHIHGNTNSNIVLGVNPDEYDELGTVDTTFLQFKKYFQRVFYNTDIGFLQNITFSRKTPKINDNDLFVIGHSLDSTDEDVIKQIFGLSKTIKIFYHNDTSVKKQIENLIRIYGKEGFDELRLTKKLLFLRQSEIQWKASDSER